MAYRPRFGSAKREALYQREALAAHKGGRGRFPICVHCDLPVTPGQDWDESHIGTPACFGGKEVGVGHRLCNQRDNNLNVTPAAAKAERVRKKHLGITGPGLGRAAMRGGRRDKISRTIRGPVIPRLSGAEKHRRLMAKRRILTQDQET